ncbi:hypothetical protein PC114_g23541 [Phytophthora cactorum]|uniref:Uncharacterized protein n=1 Tax=Phytophthora cactorum TaxID=29920 RepID=A0A8T1B9P1_9STRA|nr:hypothetical protein PC114_g23541 [Phytophthora cactorum]KAG2897131.1 hypothetical protein PC115_g17304 [Phytophthora cactorum]
MAFLRQMQPEDTKTRGMFANSGSHMLEKPLEINVPTNTLAYAVAFRDPNPIHRSNNLVDYDSNFDGWYTPVTSCS